MKLTNDFDLQRGNLKWRKNSLFGNIQEDFDYDNQDRLISYPNPNGVGVLAQTYEADGRIKTNTVGTYNYANTQKKYQNTSVTLSPEAVGYYASREGIFSDSMEDKKGWSKNAHNPSCISFDDTNAHLGKNSLKINTTGYTVSYVQSDLLIPINNTAATEYTFSGWVKSDNPTAQLTLFKYEENKTTYTTESVNTTALGNWIFITKTVVVPANSKYLNLRVDNIGTGTVWFDDVMIRKTSTTALVNFQTPPSNSYTDHQLTIDYNTFKAPVTISEAGVDKLSFVYNDNNDRSVMFYGSLDDNKTLRPNRKFYSADGSMEIKTTPSGIEFLTYLGGDGYSAPVVYKKTFDTAGNAQEQMLYLHRDYQGSILAITNDVGAVLEKRQFDAWGALLKVQDGAGNTIAGLTVLDRGYTGHEHLQSVGLINMNGRLYDPKLHRFLQPDNYVQDPSNTQNYNRYGYVLNNPLKYTDPSGEITDNCPTCPDQANNFPDGGGAGIIKSIKDFFSNKENVEWLTRNAGQAGWFIGKNINSALKDVGGFFKRLFGGGRKGSSGPPPNMATNVNMNPYTPSGSNSFGQNYGGDGSGSFVDYFSRFVYETDQFNPIALAWDGIKGNVTGTDRYNNELSGFESNMKIASAVPMTKIAGIMTNVAERLVLSQARIISSKSAQFVIYNSKYLNANNWMRLGVGSNSSNNGRVIRLSLGAGPDAFEAMSPGIMKSFNGWLKTINGNGHFYYPGWH